MTWDFADTSLWREIFPELSWAEFLAIPISQIKLVKTYWKVKAEVDKAKRAING